MLNQLKIIMVLTIVLALMFGAIIAVDPIIFNTLAMEQMNINNTVQPIIVVHTWIQNNIWNIYIVFVIIMFIPFFVKLFFYLYEKRRMKKLEDKYKEN